MLMTTGPEQRHGTRSLCVPWGRLAPTQEPSALLPYSARYPLTTFGSAVDFVASTWYLLFLASAILSLLAFFVSLSTLPFTDGRVLMTRSTVILCSMGDVEIKIRS